MRKYGFSNGNGRSQDHELKFLAFPTFDYGSEVIEDVVIPGRVGTLTKKTGRYTDTVISNSLEFEVDSINKFHSKVTAVREWLQSSKKLIYSDMEDKFFKVKKVEIADVKRKYGIYGEVTVVFTCDPSTYYVSGQEEIEAGVLINAFDWSQPLYKITGNGNCILTVNGSFVTVNVVGEIIIDTERMIAYGANGQYKNASISGNYEDLYLQPGENIVTVTEGFTCKIIPNWRCL